MEISVQRRYSPIGEYVRLLVLKRLTLGPASIGEIEQMLNETIRKLGIKYDWRIWPRLLEGEIEVKDGTVKITPYGKWIFEMTREEVELYVKKWLGVSP